MYRVQFYFRKNKKSAFVGTHCNCFDDEQLAVICGEHWMDGTTAGPYRRYERKYEIVREDDNND